MRPAIFGGRRVDEFAQAVTDLTDPADRDAADPDAARPGAAADPAHAREVAVAHALATHSDDFAPRPSDEFRQQLRATLIAAAERGMGATAAVDEPTSVLPLGLVKANGGRAGGLRRSRRVRRTRVAVIAGLAAGTLAISGISMASGNAGPGDPLYGVKRSGEDARIALAGSDADRGALYLQFARNRMGEASGTDSASTLADLFSAMDADTQKATALLTGAALSQRDPGVLDPLAQFVTAQRRDLTALGVPRFTDDSVRLLDRVDQRITVVRAAITCHAAYSDTGDPLGPSLSPCP